MNKELMMKRFAVATAIALVGLSACDDNPTNPSNTDTDVFTATLLPASEVPPVTGAEASGSGTLTMTLTVTRDNSNNITAATANFNVSVTGFPAGMALTAAHIHPGASGQTGSPVVDLALTAGEVAYATGSGSFTKNNITVSATQAAAILANPGNFYFNIHTAANPGGVARGQLALQ
jgi:hypothetical protein